MAKKKKKKKPAGAKKPTYAKGKPPAQTKKSSAVKKTAASGSKGKSGSKQGSDTDERPKQWNIIKQGTPELKVFLFLLVIIAVAGLFQYPYIQEQWQETYLEAKKEYPQKLEDFEKKYKTEEEREEHKEEKPQEPIKPTFQLFLMNIGLTSILMMAMVAFLGINVQRRTDLKTPVLDEIISGDLELPKVGNLALYALIGGVIALVPLVAGLFVTKAVGVSSDAAIITIPVWKQCLNHMYITLNLQLMLLFLIMSSLVWLFDRYRKKLKLEPHWAALAVSMILACVYATMISIVPGERLILAIITGVAVGISLVGVLGYIYWKKGLECSLVAGMISFGVTPLLASLII